MEFQVVGAITDIEIIAVGRSIRELARLRKVHGTGRWRKLKALDSFACRMVASRRPSYIGMKRTVSANGKSRSSDCWIDMKKKVSPQFVMCVSNKGYPASLEVRKVYQKLDDKQAEARSLVRIIDESGEDYLYPTEFFVPIEMPEAVARSLAVSA